MVSDKVRRFEIQDHLDHSTPNCRVYLESDGVQVLKLYFSSIENSDAGTYMCQGEIDGNRIEKSIKLNLFSK